MYNLIVSPKAERQLRPIRKLYQEEVKEAIEELKHDPFSGKLLGEELAGKYSYRIDVYRIIYLINKEDKTIYIISAGHRSSVYN